MRIFGGDVPPGYFDCGGRVPPVPPAFDAHVENCWSDFDVTNGIQCISTRSHHTAPWKLLRSVWAQADMRLIGGYTISVEREQYQYSP